MSCDVISRGLIGLPCQTCLCGPQAAIFDKSRQVKMAPTDQILNAGQSVFCPNGQGFGTNVGEIHYWGENARNP